MRIARPTILDRLVGMVSPATALERMKARTLLQAYTGGKGGYAGGKRDRRGLANFIPEGGSADADLLPEADDLRARSRHIARNVPVATGAIATNKTHVIGDGLTVKSACDYSALGIGEAEAQEWNAKADREFRLACASIDWTRVEEFGDLQDTVFGSELESGDVFAIRRFRLDAGDSYGTKVQVIEADRVSNPGHAQDTDKIKGGIEHNANGVPVAIHVADRHPGDLYRKPVKWRRVPLRYNDGRRIVIHLINRSRPDQTRGIPYFAPVIEAIKAFGDYQEAEVRAAVVSAMFTVFVKRLPGDDDAGPLAGTESSFSDDSLQLGSGAVVGLDEGEDVTIANPMRPNPNFDGFAQAFLRLVGVALELPFELLIKHFTASYSASRAALEMAYHSFRKRRSRFARQFVAEVRSWVIEEAVLTGRLDAPGFFDDPIVRQAWLRADITGPVRISLDPKKDAEADAIDRENGFKTSQQIMTERTGGDFDVKTDTISRENARLKDAGQSSERTGETSSDPDASQLKEDMEDA
ncbi:phage portal protein [Hoeflea sp.]|uniref:phage portal protein n=1 Tax=Hoeflea sp. TaxID=1940281 RepID=UPI003B51B50C